MRAIGVAAAVATAAVGLLTNRVARGRL